MILEGPRRSGRTTRLVERLKADPHARLIVVNETECQRLIREFALEPSVAMRVYSAHHPARHGMGGPVYIDNLARVLRELFGDVVEAEL